MVDLAAVYNACQLRNELSWKWTLTCIGYQLLVAPTIGIQPESNIFKSPAPPKNWLPPCFIKIPDATNDFKLEVVSI